MCLATFTQAEKLLAQVRETAERIVNGTLRGFPASIGEFPQLTISTDYKGGVGAPDYKTVVGQELFTRPDGSMFRMVRYESERFWVSYHKSASVAPVVTITIGALK